MRTQLPRGVGSRPATPERCLSSRLFLSQFPYSASKRNSRHAVECAWRARPSSATRCRALFSALARRWQRRKPWNLISDTSNERHSAGRPTSAASTPPFGVSLRWRSTSGMVAVFRAIRRRCDAAYLAPLHWPEAYRPFGDWLPLAFRLTRTIIIVRRCTWRCSARRAARTLAW